MNNSEKKNDKNNEKVSEKKNTKKTKGVASVDPTGLLEETVQIVLDHDKIDEINAQLLDLIDTKLADARAQLDSAESQSR